MGPTLRICNMAYVYIYICMYTLNPIYLSIYTYIHTYIHTHDRMSLGVAIPFGECRWSRR